MDEFSAFGDAPDSSDDSLSTVLVADRAYGYAWRESPRNHLLDRLLRPRFSPDPRLDSVARSKLRLPEYRDEESAVRACAAFQSVQLLGHRLGTHIHGWNLVQSDAPGSDLSPARRVPGRSRARVRREYAFDAAPHYTARAVTDDPRDFRPELYPRSPILQYGASS